MPILSSFGAASFAGLHYITDGAAGLASLFFYPAVDSNWGTLANWYNNSTHTATSSTYPDTTTAAVLKGSCIVKFDGDTSDVEDYKSWETTSAAYWAPPASLDMEANDLSFVSDSFYNGGAGVAEFVPGTGHRYELNTVVSYDGTYYQAIRTAQDTVLISDVPDPYYWAATTHPDVDINITGTGALVFQGVNNLRP